MALKKPRIFALAGVLAAVGVMSITASASAAVEPITEANCKEPNILLGPLQLRKPVNGFFEVRKLNQKIPLVGGSFAGTIGLCAEEALRITGSITNSTITFPAFTQPIRILGLGGQESEITGEIKQFGPGEGTITKPPGEFCTPTTCNSEGEFTDITLNVQAEANFLITQFKFHGVTFPLQCSTSEPIKLPFVKEISIFELLIETTITGSATVPSFTCAKGPFSVPAAKLFTQSFSGPSNPYSVTFGRTEFG
jgi:hypothetical protein